MDWGGKYRGLWLTDYDGTIKQEGALGVCEADKAALRRLGGLGWLRAVATGRSLFNFAKVWEPGLELDALIFAGGAGLCPWSPMGPGPLLASSLIEGPALRQAIEASRRLGFGFFAYHEMPDNHYFYYERPAGQPPLGFFKRLEIFAGQHSPWPADYFTRGGYARISQIMLMIPAGAFGAAEREFRAAAPSLSVLRSTSPFGDGCLWLEAFAPGTSKGLAAAGLAARVGLDASRAVALGNDYNDRELLDWAGTSFVTADAPAEMRPGHVVMPVAGQGGLAWALDWVLARG